MLKVFEFIEIVAAFHAHVMREHTGDAGIFAAKLGISRSCLYNLISELKNYGIDIEYNRDRRTFMYLYPERVDITVSIRQYDENVLK